MCIHRLFVLIIQLWFSQDSCIHNQTNYYTRMVFSYFIKSKKYIFNVNCAPLSIGKLL